MHNVYNVCYRYVVTTCMLQTKEERGSEKPPRGATVTKKEYF